MKWRYSSAWFIAAMLLVCAVAVAAITYAFGWNKPIVRSDAMVVPTLSWLLEQKDAVDVKWAADKYAIGDAAILLSYETRNKIETCGCSPFQLGGIAPRVSLIKAVREKMPVLVLDAGSVGDGDDSFNLLKLQTVIAAMRVAQYDGVNIGVQEMLLPPQTLLEYFINSGVPLYSANVFAKHLKVIGAADVTDFPLTASPVTGAFPLAPPGFLSKRLGREFGVVFLQFTQLTKAPSIRSDYIIGDPEKAYQDLLSKLDSNAPKQWILVAEGYQPPIEAFANKHPEIVLVLSGNSHIPEEDNVPLQLSSGAYWFNTFLWGKYLGIVNIGNAGLSRKPRFVGTNIPLLSTYAPDSEVLDIIKKDLHSKFKEIFHEQSFEYKAANVIPPEDCKDCHEEAYNVFEASGHAKALKTLEDKGQQYNVDCISCHVVYDYTNDTMYDLQCISCHQEINPVHGFNRQAGRKETLVPVAKPTYEFCARCHTPEQSTPFKANFKRYLTAIKHWK